MQPPTPLIDLRPERGALPEDGGTVRALLRIEVGFPSAVLERPPVNLALVVDRSGSMSGPPLAHAKRAAAAAVEGLREGDRVAVVAYDQHVHAVVPSTAVGEDRGALLRAIDAITAGGTTALHAGWVEGCTQVLTGGADTGLARVVLLTDGLANVGVTDPDGIAADVRGIAAEGVSTSTVGLGRGFDERLLRIVADAGGGNFTYAERPEELPAWFEAELAGLSGLRGRDLRLTLVGRGVRWAHALGGGRVDGATLHLPDLIAGLPRELLVTLAVEPHARLEGLRLDWSDALLGGPARLDHALDVPTVAAGAYAATQPDDGVAAAVRGAEADERMARIDALIDGGALPEAERELAALRVVAAAWPADARRAERLAELDRLLHAVVQRDDMVARKMAAAAAHERARGVKGDAMLRAARSEKAWTQAHRAAKAAPVDPGAGAAAGAGGTTLPPTRRAARPSAAFDLHRTDGSRVRLEVAVGDLTEEAVDAIVNPTNRGLFGTAGVDGAVHRRGGPELTAACREIGTLRIGHAVVTAGYRLPAARVIHTASLPWKGGAFGELASLEAAYAASFDVARRLRLRSIALPAMGTGTYGYPLTEAIETAVAVALRAALSPGELALVRFVPFDVDTADAYRAALARAVPQAAAPSSAPS